MTSPRSSTQATPLTDAQLDEWEKDLASHDAWAFVAPSRDTTAALVAEVREARATTWPDDDDRPIPEDDAIKAAHPTRSGAHEAYAEAMRMVGAKRSKAALIELVTWLMVERDAARARERVTLETLKFNVAEVERLRAEVVHLTDVEIAATVAERNEAEAERDAAKAEVDDAIRRLKCERGQYTKGGSLADEVTAAIERFNSDERYIESLKHVYAAADDDGAEIIRLHAEVQRVTRERDAARDEVDRLRGLIQSELINDAHYCETCETAYQSPEGMPPRCPRCELDAAEEDVQAARSALREARAALAKAEAERDEADGELSKHIASANRYGSVTENTRRLASALGMREGKHTADSIAEAALEELTARRAEVERLGAQVNDHRAEHAAGPLDALQITSRDRDEWKRRAVDATGDLAELKRLIAGREAQLEEFIAIAKAAREHRELQEEWWGTGGEHVTRLVEAAVRLDEALRRAGY